MVDAAAIRPALGPLLRHVRAALQEGGVAEAPLDARLLVEHFTGTGRSDAVLDPERAVAPDRVEAVLSGLSRRLAGEPVHRIIGRRDFYGMTLRLSPGTLEPRPDTETLVDLALPHARAIADRYGECRILDLGTGTGAVALALLKEEPRARAVGVDISDDALETALVNAEMTGSAGRFLAIKSHWFDAIEASFHLIVSNPPYISSNDMASLDREVREHDPSVALDGGADGLEAYRAIAGGAARHLEAGGIVAVEIGHDQARSVPAVFAAHGWVLAGGADDLAGTRRALVFSLGKPLGKQ